MADEESDESSRGQANGLARALLTLLGIHVEHAQEEAAADAQRVGGAFVLLVAAMFFALLAVASLHAAVVAELHDAFGWSVSTALAACAGADLVIGAALVSAARARLATPLLARTRTLVRRTLDSLRAP